MTSTAWGVLVLGLVALSAVLAWIAFARRIGPLRREQATRFVCPEKDQAVDCVLVQDIRTGQWKELRACTALGPEGRCDLDCAKLMNLGFKLKPV